MHYESVPVFSESAYLIQMAQKDGEMHIRWVRSILMSFDVRCQSIKVEEPVINCYFIIGVQISTSVSLVRVKMVDDVWMASMNTHVPVLQDGQELTVNSVS